MTVFVDTNVLVYRHDSSDPAKQARADDWYAYLWRSRSGRLSVQVLQELYATLTRKLKPGMESPRARRIVRALGAWEPLGIDLATIERAWILEQRNSLSWWDALIVAAAQTTGCRILLTEDLQDGQAFGEVRVVDPFASADRSPEEIVQAAYRTNGSTE